MKSTEVEISTIELRKKLLLFDISSVLKTLKDVKKLIKVIEGDNQPLNK
jgi:hypothetical protein